MKLGSTGLDVSAICLGCMSYGVPTAGRHPWSLDEETSRPFFRQAIEAGINFFDTANVYSDGTSEEITGRALADYAQRDEVVLATKVHGRMHEGPNGAGLSRKAILTQIDHSLRRLGTDYVDLYQIHRWDHHTPIEETMEALHDVVQRRQGAVHRRIVDVGLAVRQGTARRRAQRLDQVRVDAEPLQPAPSRGGAGDAAAVRRPGRRGHPVEPIGARPPDAGRGDRRRRAARPTSSAARCTRREMARSSRPRSASPTSAVFQPPRSRWRGSPAIPRSSRRSSVRRSRTTSRTPWPRSSSS